MVNARVGKAVPVNTNLTRMNWPHCIIKRCKVPSTNTTIYTNFLVNFVAGTDPECPVLVVNTPKTRPAGFVVYSPDYDWGSTTPGHFTLLPSDIEVDVCIYGPGILGIDTSDVADASYFGAAIYDSAVAGIVAAPASAAAYGDTDLDAAGYVVIGMCLDQTVGNTGTGTGVADKDPVEVFFGYNPHHAVST